MNATTYERRMRADGLDADDIESRLDAHAEDRAQLARDDDSARRARLNDAAPDMARALFRLTHPAADDTDLDFALSVLDRVRDCA